MTFKVHAIALAAAIACLPAHAQEAASTGKRIDNARTDWLPVPPATERQPAWPWPLPSGVSRSEAEIMKAAVKTLPTVAPQQESRIDEQAGLALFDSGRAELTASARQQLDALIATAKDKRGLRIAVAGHTDNQRLSPASKKRYKDNQGLSEARALAVAAYLKQSLSLNAAQLAIEGFGEHRPVGANDTPEGMQRNRRVELRVWFEQSVTVAPVVPVAVAEPPPKPLPRAACAQTAASAAGLPFRVTIDGEPVTPGEAPIEADRQRCTDVALERADIQVRFDSLALAPELNVWATPNAAVKGEPVQFRAWSNYASWIKKAELRLFKPGQKPQETPFAVLPMNWVGPVSWTAPTDAGEVLFLLRVYDAEGRFDETSLKPLALRAHAPVHTDADKAAREALTGYGANSLALRNIRLSGGTVTVNGTHMKPGQRVEAFGLNLPVDDKGVFAMRQILPAGPQTVEVKVTDADGHVSGFRRNLTIPVNDWFYVAMGDLTLGRNNVSGPAALVTGDTQHYDSKVYFDGRAAFYLKGKIKGEWLLTAAADTREQPVRDLFSSFSSKDPRYLLRNIDPNAYYPVYGDDSTTVDDAPTQGKFYVRLEKGNSHVMWGNFQTAWSGSELIQYSRGLYGAEVRYRSESANANGEKRTQLDAFAAQPGTVDSREEFRGTGGSLYSLAHLDITQGSERVWVEVRDPDSGLVIERKLLTPAQDYDINTMQGRIILRDPLASTASGGGTVLTSALGGQPQYLVVTYEYVPGLTAVSNMTRGARVHTWLTDWLGIGLTAYRQGEAGNTQTLKGGDLTLRYKPGTFLKLEGAHSSGAGTGTLSSLDGGFAFNGQHARTTSQDAKAHRVDAAIDFTEVGLDTKGHVAAYEQNRERGYSAPGQLATNGEAVRQSGIKADAELRPGTTVAVKADKRDGDTQTSHNTELTLGQKLGDAWLLTGGVRRDSRENAVANASPTLSQNGGRTDALLRLDYAPLKSDGKPGEKEDWSVYGFAQGTLARDGSRELNDRVGAGGAWQVTERIKALAEASGGSLGGGGKLGIDYRLSDRSNAYLTYRLESDDPNVDYRGRQGTWVAGGTTRVSDQVRLFGETKSTHGAGPDSLAQAFGADWAPNDRWTFGSKVEFGLLSDPVGGDIRRKALSVSTAYKEGGTKYTGSVEWRNDDSTATGPRRTWLLRNMLGIQATPGWRLLGKFNYQHASNTQGAFADGDFHEYVAAAAYRPVDNDRWNLLFKYTHFYNLPTTAQVANTASNTDYAQKSQVFAVDGIVDVKPWLAVGGKVAVRVGQLKDLTVSGDWFDSRATLVVLRTDWHWVKAWSVLAEVRKLSARETSDARAGALVAVYRQVAEGVKLGAGYNFTNYSDDLTDLGYRSRGWFVNVLGTM